MISSKRIRPHRRSLGFLVQEIPLRREAVPEEVNGISIADTLLGNEQEERGFLYREFQGYRGQQAVWLGNKWKGIRTDILKKENKEPLKIELFDMESDPSESTDVAAANPEMVSEIKALMSSERSVSEEFQMGPLDEVTN